MLSLLRHLRQGSLSRRDLTRYALYAGGEILLIVIGILLALQIDTWNQEREQREKEIGILQSFQRELQADLADIEFSLAVNERSHASLNTLIDHMAGTAPYHDSLRVHFGNAMVLTIFLPTTSTFETLKSVGVDLVSNKALRNRIIRVYDAQYRFLDELEQIYRDRVIKASEEAFDAWFEDFFALENNPSGYGITVVPLDYASLRQDRSFRYFVRSLRNMHEPFLEQPYRNTRDGVIEVLEQIKEELEVLEA